MASALSSAAASSLCCTTGLSSGGRARGIEPLASTAPIRRGHHANPPSRLVAVRAQSDLKAVLDGVVFEPFREVQTLTLPHNPHESLARQRFDESCEAAINEQINVEYNASYIYHSLFAFFDRDDVALPGLASYFKRSSDEERGHAESFMKYQNTRGGRVRLLAIVVPDEMNAFAGSPEKGDALSAMELTLALEKLTTEKLYALHGAAEAAHDLHLAHVIRTEFLPEQFDAIKKVSEFVSQLRRIGNDGHGVYYWDRLLLEDEAKI